MVYSQKFDATPLYHAATCGLANLMGYLIVKYPLHVNVTGGYNRTPLVAALAERPGLATLS